MDQPGDEMLFGVESQESCVHPSIPDIRDKQCPPGSERKRSRPAASNTNTHPVIEDRDDFPPDPTPISQFNSSTSSPSPIVELPPGKRDREWIIARIEDIFERHLDNIASNDSHLYVLVKSRHVASQNEKGCGKPTTVRKFQFPGKSEKEAWRFTVVTRILELIFESLVSGVTITKRDIYYRDPALFSKQAVVDRYVDDLACTFGVSRLLLNIAATAKGLIAGCFTIQKQDGVLVDGKSEHDGLLISRLAENETANMDKAQWILLVEKEATFRSLVSSGLWAALVSHGVLVTAKGYPDIATRSHLRSLALPSKQNNFKECPVYALMDYDPDGIDILSTYKHGSMSLAHENDNLKLPSVHWLGLHSSDIGQENDLHQSQGLMSLSSRDRRKANRMLEREPFVEDGKEPKWRREIQVILMLNVKAEIQLLDAQSGGLPGWLKTRGIS